MEPKSLTGKKFTKSLALNSTITKSTVTHVHHKTKKMKIEPKSLTGKKFTKFLALNTIITIIIIITINMMIKK
uniref:Uncharacterized protein n=1 Tax=Acrobeloides nanus TaxID=290746 RepID=A0A914C1M7_9BILA